MNDLNKNQAEDDNFLLASGFDDCIIGLSTKELVVYDADKMISKLMHRDEMTQDEAIEFFYFNIDGAYVGDKTPLYVFTGDHNIEEIFER